MCCQHNWRLLFKGTERDGDGNGTNADGDEVHSSGDDDDDTLKIILAANLTPTLGILFLAGVAIGIYFLVKRRLRGRHDSRGRKSSRDVERASPLAEPLIVMEPLRS